MSDVIHGMFSIERVYPYPPARVFRAWSQPGAKAAWFHGPGEWTAADPHQLDFREGGRERLSGGLPGGTVHTYDATYQDIVPNRRIVYTYTMFVGSAKMSVSVATVELHAEGKGTRLVFTEQAAFVDGADGTKGREAGTRDLLEGLGHHLDDEGAREMVVTRVIDASPAAIFATYVDPARLARWWGPAGFTNNFHTFEFRPGGAWHFTMIGPDGGKYDNEWVFDEIVPDVRIAAHHLSAPRFTLVATFDAEGGGTRVTWVGRFEDADTCRKVRRYADAANEQNLDRLEAELARYRSLN